MYNQGELEKKERRKIIIAATVAVTMILILLVAIIVVAVKKSSKTSVSSQSNTAFELKEEETENSDIEGEFEETEEAKEEPEVQTDNTESIGVISTKKNDTQEVVAATVNEELPNTGAGEILPIAILLGMLTMYLSSAALAKKEA